MEKHWEGVIPFEGTDIRVYATKVSNNSGKVLEWYGIGTPVKRKDAEKLLKMKPDNRFIQTLLGKVKLGEIKTEDRLVWFTFIGVDEPAF